MALFNNWNGKRNVSFYCGRAPITINQHFKQINTSTASERNWFLSLKTGITKGKYANNSPVVGLVRVKVTHWIN